MKDVAKVWIAGSNTLVVTVSKNVREVLGVESGDIVSVDIQIKKKKNDVINLSPEEEVLFKELKEETKMVERKQAETFDEFVGTVESVEVVKDTLNPKAEQYHIQMNPEDVEIKGKTGKLHEWIRISEKCTETAVPEGSILDKFLAELEVLDKAVKKLSTHTEAMASMVGNKYKFVKKKLGKSFDGHEAKNYWTPVQIM